MKAPPYLRRLSLPLPFKVHETRLQGRRRASTEKLKQRGFSQILTKFCVYMKDVTL